MNGCEPEPSHNNYSLQIKSLPVPLLLGGRDKRGNEAAPEIVSAAEKLAASNAAANTTKTKSVKLLNSYLIPNI